MPRPASHSSPSLANKLATPMVTESGLYHRSKARGLLNASNLPALQNLLKREPKAYTNEFQSQWNHFQSLISIFTSLDYLESNHNDPTSGNGNGNGNGGNQAGAGAGVSSGTGTVGNRLNKEQETKFKELLAFVTQLSSSYPEITANYPNQLKDLLLNHSSNLSNDIKNSCIRSIVLLRNRNLIDSQQLLQTLFPLLPQSSPSLRSLIQSTILTDLRTSNSKSKNHRLNKFVQGLLFSIVEKGMSNNNAPNADGAQETVAMDKREKNGKPKGKVEALWAVKLAAELWRRGIWNDSKTISLLSFAVFHPHPSVSSLCIRFFLGDLHSSESGNQSSDSESEQSKRIPDLSSMQHARKVNKKTRSGDKKVRAAAAIRRKNQRELEQGRDDGQDFAGSSAVKGEGFGGENNIAAIHLLNDPQNFAEKLFDLIVRGEKRKDLSLELKVRITQLLSRVMGTMKLTVLPFYGWINKYLVPHQPHITLLLVSLAQSVHDQTPPDVLTPLLNKISNSFIHPGVGPEVLSAGLNSIREISSRQPWCMEPELLSDLILYRSSKDKGVSNAARGLLALFREVNPALLPRRERGKSGEEKVRAGITPKGFGETDEGVKGIQGLDLFRNYLEEKSKVGDEGQEEEEDWKNWEVEEDEEDSDDSGGWINVESDGDDEIEISDSDSDEEKKLKSKKKEKKVKKVKKSFADRDSEDESQDSGEDSSDQDSDSDEDENSDDGDDDDEEEEGKSTKAAAKERSRVRREMKKAQRNSKKGLKSRKERKLSGRDEVDEEMESQDEEEENGEGGQEDGEADEKKRRKQELLEKKRLEMIEKEKEKREELELEEKKLTELATQRILTPADFAKIHELRLSAASALAQSGGRAGKAASKEVEILKAQKRGRLASNLEGDANESALLDEYAILGPRKKAKADYEERMKSIEKGREGREKFGSRKGKKEAESSTTNEKKKRGKNFQMVSRSWNVRNKKNASLKEKSKKLRAHIDKGKKRMK